MLTSFARPNVSISWKQLEVPKNSGSYRPAAWLEAPLSSFFLKTAWDGQSEDTGVFIGYSLPVHNTATIMATENRSQNCLHYGKDMHASLDAILPPFVSTLLESNFGLLSRCTGHTHQCTPCKSASTAPNSTWALKMSNEHRGCGQGTLSISGQGLGDHHYRLHSVRLCVELQPFAILWGNQGIWHQLSSRTGQSKYTVSTFLQALIIFSLEGQDKTQTWD